MHRKHLRATVGSADFDIQTGVWVDGQFLRFSGGVIDTAAAGTVSGPATTVVNQVATWNNTTGTLLAAQTVTISGGAIASVTTINGTALTSFVTRTGATPFVNELAAWNSSAANQIGYRTVTLDLSGNFVGVTTINTINPATWVVGPASSVNTAIAVFNGSTGKLIANSSVYVSSGGDISSVNTINGVAPSTWVTGPASTSIGIIPVFANTSGKVLSNSGVTLASGSFSGVSQINGVSIASYALAQGPAVSSTNVAVFGGPNAQSIGESSVTLDVGTGDMGNIGELTCAAVFANDVDTFTINGNSIDTFVRYSGAGPLANELVAINVSTAPYAVGYRPVTLDVSGNFANAGTFNGVTVENHSGRHLFSGADSLYNTGVTWGTADSLTYGGASTEATPLFRYASLCSSASIGSSSTIPSGASIGLSPRSASYAVRWAFGIALSDTGGNIEVRVSWSSGSGVAIVSGPGGAFVSSSSGSAVTFTTSGLPATFSLIIDLGLQSASANPIVSVAFRKSSGSNFSVYDNGTVTAMQTS